jgi:hypothetical protein
VRSGPEDAPVLQSGCKRDNNTQDKKEQGEDEQFCDHDTITGMRMRISDLPGNSAREYGRVRFDSAGIFIAITIQIIGECEFNMVIALCINNMMTIWGKSALFCGRISRRFSQVKNKKRRYGFQ